MGDVCAGAGLPVTACSLTLSTGLSLAESIALVGVRDGVATDELVGPATTFFSYSWGGTTLGDVLDALERALPRLASDELHSPDRAARPNEAGATRRGPKRFVWIDLFAASQNLLAGRYMRQGPVQIATIATDETSVKVHSTA